MRTVKIHKHHSGYWGVFDSYDNKVLKLTDDELSAIKWALSYGYLIV